MGTYTTNYQLYMPTIGEQGWGDLVNGNFITIDTTMKGLDTRIGALEPLSDIHVDENRNVTFPGSVTATGGFNLGTIGKITTETGVISGVYLSYENTLGSVSGSGTTSKSVTLNYTYKANPINNDVTFTITVAISNVTRSGNGYIQINDIEIFSFANGTPNSTKSNNVTVTLNDGDAITIYLYSSGGNCSASAKMGCMGYLVNA